MAIKFSCPNGHPLTGREDQAGREGKCPKCGVPIVVPQASAASPFVETPVLAPSPSSDLIVFLCPNGHRLHGPRNMEGRAGQCPHCNATFRIPRQDDPDDEEEPGSRILVGAIPDSGELAVQGVSGSDVPAAEEPFFNFNFEEPGQAGRGERGSSVVNDVPLETGGSQKLDRHPLADLFTRFWDERVRGAVVELHLADGVVVVPERYAREQSRGKYGVFAVKEPDGTHTMTVVAWEAVSRISVRRVSKLPRKMFD